VIGDNALLAGQLLDAIAVHRVADRPDRFEPRKRKQPFIRVESMVKTKGEMLKGVRKIQVPFVLTTDAHDGTLPMCSDIARRAVLINGQTRRSAAPHPLPSV
jgi:hypothetical protein